MMPPLHFGVLAAPATICLYEDVRKLTHNGSIKCASWNFIIMGEEVIVFQAPAFGVFFSKAEA
jgi:hypothetical protein